MRRAASPGLTQVLEAGGVVLQSAEIDPAVPVAEQVVRSYAHDVLGARVVARVASEVIGPAIDATMEFLGFDKPTVSPPVGVALHGALGFPESALIADPDNARYALAVVKDLNRLGRSAKSRAGYTKERMEALGATLEKGVPKFLPSYYEQCGRIFISHENMPYASAMFAKARAAESTYNLDVDEEQRLAVFLEFAFAGALSAKAFDDYAKTLTSLYEPAVAFGHFRTLAIQRSRGGLAPWAQMMEATKRLAKAAKLDADEAQRELFGELLRVPSVRFGSLTFWKSIRSLVIKEAQRDSWIRGALLNLRPTPSVSEWWLELLSECGALDSLSTLDDSLFPPETRPVDGPAEWLNDMIRRGGSKSTQMPSLLAAMAPRLRQDGIAIQFHAWATVAMLDLALELGIPCAQPQGLRIYPFNSRSERPLLFLGKSSDLRDHVTRSVEFHMNRGDVKNVASHPGLMPFVADWIDQRIRVVETHESGTQSGVVECSAAVRELGLIDRTLVESVPNGFERLATASGAAMAARQLRAGLFVEYCWPALESVVATMGDSPASTGQPASANVGKSKSEPSVTFAESWPYLVVYDKRRAVVVDHERVVMEHDLQGFAAQSRFRQLAYIDGELFVAWSESGSGRSYWSSNPSAIASAGVDLHMNRYPPIPSSGVVSGGRTFGGRAVRVGDISVGSPAAVVTDGRNYWVEKQRQNNYHHVRDYIEFDPSDGKPGRVSLPQFAEQLLGEHSEVQNLALAISPDGLTHSPLGVKEGLVGAVVLWLEKLDPFTPVVLQPSHVVRIDGRQATVPATHPSGAFWNVQTLIEWPSFDGLYSVNRNGVIADIERGTIVSATPTWPTLHGALLAPMYWHYLQVRDPAGSKVLRGLTADVLVPIVELVNRLIDSAVPADSFDVSVANDEVTNAVAAALPGVTDPVLHSEIGVTVLLAAGTERKLRSWAGEKHAGEVGGFTAPAEAVERDLRNASLGVLHWSHNACLRTQLEAMTFVLAADPGKELAIDRKSRSAIGSGVSATALLIGVPAVLFKALLASVSEEERVESLAYVESWLASPFSHPERFSLYKFSADSNRIHDRPIHWGTDQTAWFVTGGRGEWIGNDRRFVGEALVCADQPVPIDGFDAVRVPIEPAYATREQVATLIEMIRERGAVAAFTPEAVAAFARETGRSLAESATVLAGLRGLHYESELPEPLRESLGRKPTEMKVAKKSFLQADLPKYQRALINAIFADPASLWSISPVEFAQRLGTAWAGVFGRQAEIDDRLLASVDRVLKERWLKTDPGQILAEIAGPSPKFTAQVEYSRNDHNNVVSSNTDVAITDEWVRSVARTVTLIASDLPLGDPWRTRAGEALRKLRDQLARGVLVPWSTITGHLPALTRLFTEADAPVGQSKVLDVDDMVVSVCCDQQGNWIYWRFFLRSERYLENSPVRAIAESSPGSSVSDFLPIWSWLLSTRAKAVSDELVEKQGPEGSYLQNPLVSVRELVGEVAGSLNVGEPSAALFLQTLALPEPTSARIRQWNKWTTTQITDATVPLLDKGFLVPAKRVGAGREVFLPGGWIDMASPALGIEDWKASMFAITTKGPKRFSSFGRVFPLDPVPTLFQTAWDRWSHGDRPGFETVGAGLGERKKKK